MVVGRKGECILLSSEAVQRIAKHHMNQNRAVFSKRYIHTKREYFSRSSAPIYQPLHKLRFLEKLNTVLIVCIYLQRCLALENLASFLDV